MKASEMCVSQQAFVLEGNGDGKASLDVSLEAYSVASVSFAAR
jgi:hypothetical protein